MQNANTKNLISSVKLLLVSGALTGTVWLWSMFANKSIEDLAKKNLALAKAKTQPPPTNVPVVVQPLGTEVPIDSPISTVAPTSSLRSVVVPQGGAVPLVTPVVVMSGGSSSSSSTTNTSSGGNPSNPPPVTSTGSSTP